MWLLAVLAQVSSDSNGVPQLTIGLGIIAAALVAGQMLFYRYVHLPALEHATKALEDEVARSADAVAVERARSERLEAEVKRQNDVLQDKALPALIAATSTVSESQALLRDLRREQELMQLERERAERAGRGT